MRNREDARPEQLWSLIFGALCLAAAYPLWSVRWPPLQDLPQHLAAIRVLHDQADASLGFSQYFDVHLFRTQYLAYYLAADLLSFLMDVQTANLWLMTGFVVGTPYAVRSLLRATGDDGRLALLSLPLTYNAHLILGFLNFLAAIPLALWGVALAVRQRRQWSNGRAVGLGALAILCFYTHVVPFAFLGLGVVLVAPWGKLRELLKHGLPLLPAGLAALWWVLSAPAGKATLSAAAGVERGPRPTFQSFDRAVQDAPNWLTDVLQGDLDRQLLWAWLATVVGCLALAMLRSAPSLDRLSRSLTWRLRLLPLVALALYFVMPTGYDWIWPIAQRFPVLAAVMLVAVMPRPRGSLVLPVLLAGMLLGGAHIYTASRAFERFESQEVGDFEAALQSIPKGQRVAGLIFQRGSRHVRFSPFIHYVAYYQAFKGGAVMFTFADFPQSPFRFKPHQRPPRVGPRWEWLPQRVNPARDLQWYDYVLVRGGPGRIAKQRQFRPVHRGKHWSVWRRLGPSLTLEETIERPHVAGPQAPELHAETFRGVPAHDGVDGSLFLQGRQVQVDRDRLAKRQVHVTAQASATEAQVGRNNLPAAVLGYNAHREVGFEPLMQALVLASHGSIPNGGL